MKALSITFSLPTLYHGIQDILLERYCAALHEVSDTSLLSWRTIYTELTFYLDRAFYGKFTLNILVGQAW